MIHSMYMHDSEYVIICTIAVSSISHTLNNFWILSYLHSYYIQTIYTDKKVSINNIFIKYVEPLLDNINNTAFEEECKLSLYAAAYEKQLDTKVNKPSDKK